MASKLNQAIRERDQVERKLARRIAEREHVEQRILRKKARKEEVPPEDTETLERLNDELAEDRADLDRINRKVDNARGRLRRLARRIKRWRRRRRAQRRDPKVVDLNFPGSSGAMGPIKGSIGHYTAGAYAEDDDQAVRLWRLVDSQHRSQGWAMIGYHIGLGPDGGVYLLRPLRYSGAHTMGYNTGYVGFSVHGTTGDTWTDAQLAALRYALERFGLHNKPVWGHNDFNATACPGAFKKGYVTKGRDR